MLVSERAACLTLSSRRLRAMATRVELHLMHRDDRRIDDALDAVAEEIERVEQALSAHRPGAALHNLNLALGSATSASVGDDLLWEALTLAFEFSRESGGLFDPALGWRTLSGDGAPGQVRLDAANRTLITDRAGVRIDLGGIGKGLALDRLRPVLDTHGVVSGLISLGESSVLALGRHPHGPYWPLSAPDPFRPGADLIALGLRDLCWSVSSNLDPGEDGVRLNPHVLDPRSGEPITALRTVLALHRSGARAEAVSTAMMATSPSERAALAQGFDDTPIAVFDHDANGAAERQLFNGMEAWLI